MSIVKYEILNPTNKRKPFLNQKGFFLFPVKKAYKYYIECATTNEFDGNKEYFLLLGTERFDENCRICKTDSYGRCNIKVQGEIKSYIINEIQNKGCVNVEHIETNDDYDIFSIT